MRDARPWQRLGAEQDVVLRPFTATLEERPASREERPASREQRPVSRGSTAVSDSASTSAGDTATAVDEGDVGDCERQAGAEPEPEPESERTFTETLLIMVALSLAISLAALDMTIVTTAVPTIAAHFGSSTGYVWIGGAYLLGNAALVPTWGKISDIFGRKPVLVGAVAVFWLGSLLCAVSTSMGMLVAARAVQGVGGGGTLMLPNIAISDLFSMRRRSLFFGLFGCVWAVASAVGPVLGGVFATRLSWRWCFYINLPLGAVAIVILVAVLRLHNPRTPVAAGLAAIDWAGSALVVGGTLMLLLGLELGGVDRAWGSPAVVGLVGAGAVAIGLFAAYEARLAPYPLMPLGLFASRSGAAAFGLSFLHAFAFMGASYWLPLYLQAVVGASSLMSGVYLLPFVLALSIVSACTGVVIRKTGNYKLPIVAGLLVMTLGFGLMIGLGADGDWVRIVLFQIVAGLGVGPNFQAPLIAIQSTVEPRDVAAATSSFGFLRQLGTAISVVVGGVVFANEMQKQQPALARQFGHDLAARFGGPDAAASVTAIGQLQPDARRAVRGAYWHAMQTMFIVYTCFAFAGLLVSLLVAQKRLSTTHTEHKTGLTSLKHRTEAGRAEEKR